MQEYTKMDTGATLQQQSIALLQRLKVKQGALQKLIGVESGKQSPASEKASSKHVFTVANYHTNLKATKDPCQKAKEQLSSKSKLPQGSRDLYSFAQLSENHKTRESNREASSQRVRSKDGTGLGNFRNPTERNCSDKLLQGKNVITRETSAADIVDLDQTKVLKCIDGPATPISVKLAFNTRNKTPITPNSVTKRRRIIDRNIPVGDGSVIDVGDDSLDSSRLLNYSYSQLNDSSINADTTRRAGDAEDSRKIDNRHDPSYVEKLTDGGNNKKMASFVRETTIRPKSILNSPGPHGPKKRNGTNGRVSFRQSTGSGRTSPSFLEDTTSKQLLGYDWIAGLIDNDPTTIDQSEAFFDELRDFRRVNREECENKSYMEGPLSIIGSAENTAVKEALETKVKPFTINERLFTVPVKNGWMADVVGEATDDTIENKEPSYEAPRFVRVSIPRSTLLSPHRVKPHRRRSFDPTDTMSLGQHCLMGWDSSRPAILPSASNVALKDASKGVKTKIATTLEEAEKIASSFYWPNSAPPPTMASTNHRLAKDSILQLRYASLLNRSQIQERLEQTGLSNKSTSLPGQTNLSTDLSIHGGSKQFSCFPPGGRDQSTSLNKSCTEQLLDTTYSLMYELERQRQDANTRLQTNVSVH